MCDYIHSTISSRIYGIPLHPSSVELRVRRGIKRVKIDLYLRNTVKGFIGVGERLYPNRLCHNFYRLLWGILSGSNVSMQDVSGSWYTARIMGDIVWGKARIDVCNEDYDLGFGAYKCTVNGYCDAPTATTFVGTVNNTHAYCAEWGCSIDVSGNSIFSFFKMFDINGGEHWAGMAFRLLSVSSGQTIKHRICFLSPWMRNMAAIIAAIACDCNDNTATDLNGAEFNIYGINNPIAGAADIYIISGGNILTTYMYRYSDITDTYAYIHLTGLIVPTDNITADKILLVVKIHDTAGNSHDVPILTIAENVSLEKGKLYAIAVHIIGG